MKRKLIFSTCSLLISLLSFGQERYKSFISQGITKWAYESPQDGCCIDEIDAYGDTIINQLAYKKLWTTHFLIQAHHTDAIQQWREYNVFSGSIKNVFIRQSSDASKLYLLDTNENIERLIVDMDLKVGDEFTHPFPFEIDTVESITYKDERKHIHFKNIEPAGRTLTFIEGIGPSRYILSGTFVAGPPYDNFLICYSNDSYFYRINDYYTCACGDTQIRDIGTDTYKITKLSDFIEISFTENAHRTWRLFDISGRETEKSSIVNWQSIQIPITELKSGIYIARIYNRDNKEYKSIKITL
jgi:hypothetical protein